MARSVHTEFVSMCYSRTKRREGAGLPSPDIMPIKRSTLSSVFPRSLFVLGGIMGLVLYFYLAREHFTQRMTEMPGFVLGLITAVILSSTAFYLVVTMLVFLSKKMADRIIFGLQGLPSEKLIGGTIGMTGGLVVAYLINGLLSGMTVPYFRGILSTGVYLFLSYLGALLATREGREIHLKNVLTTGMQSMHKTTSQNEVPQEIRTGIPKIMDTSVIIDGRIADIRRAGFVEGPLIIPEFVLDTLRHIADSSDVQARNRGRRGLEMLALIQQELKDDIRIESCEFPGTQNEDAKLLKLAAQMKGKVLTGNPNLKRSASLQGIEVLNINELAEAIKPAIHTGDQMKVMIIEAGKEAGQGLAYLNDGTMIVVANGRKLIGETVDVVITSVLQTSAGRMIFANLM